MPHAQIGQDAEIGAPLQASLVSALQAAGVDAVALSSTEAGAAAAEAASKQCVYLLQASAERKAAGGLGGLFKKIAPVAGALPILGSLRGGSGGGLLNGATQLATQQAARSAAATAQQQAMQQMAGAQQSNVKSGDTISLKYRLLARAGTEPLKSDTLDAQASADGEDVVGPLVQRLAGSVAATGIGRSPAPAAGGAPQGLGCEQLAATPNAPVSLEACQKMAAAQKGYAASASDPGASRPGDEQMSCDQIMAEFKQQQFTRPDQAKVREGQAASSDLQQTVMKQEAEMAARAARQQVVVDSASAADRATEMATMGMVQGHATAAADAAAQAENKVAGERAAAESAPKFRRNFDATSNIATDMAAQMQANPRLGRLMQLAQAKRCHQ